jgi:hypothetical protein
MSDSEQIQQSVKEAWESAKIKEKEETTKSETYSVQTDFANKKKF